MEVKHTDLYEIHFKDRPTRFMISKLKSNGMLWHSKRQCWTRSNTGHSLIVIKDFVMQEIKDELDNYLKFRIPPKLFLRAILTNDLYATVVRADVTNIDRIPQIVKLVNDTLPMNAWGSEEVFNNWLMGGN